jgi:hypothetical protein
MSIREFNLLFKSLTVIEIYEILTRGYCDDYLTTLQDSIKSGYIYQFVNSDLKNLRKLDLVDLYLSDQGFTLLTKRDNAEKLKKVFESWELFYNVWYEWYGGDVYKVGFNYTIDSFEVLYKEWIRNKKLEKIGI